MIVREPAVAGLFYPANEDQLRAQLRGLLDASRTAPVVQPAPKALVVPHAGYIYSGSTAADGYATVATAASQITRVVLLGPCHRVALGGLAMSGADAWRTPLSDVLVYTPEELARFGQVVNSPESHAPEHSLEVQVPFLQTVLGEFTLVPLAVGDATPDEVADVLDALWGGPETLVVVSSDLSHYLRAEQAERVDAETLDLLRAGSAIDHHRACGATPINGLLEALRRRGLGLELIAYRHSGDTAGDRDRVVGYAALRAGELG